MSTYAPHLRATDLDRSPSLSSNSSGADSTASSVPTPNLPSHSSFSSAHYPSSKDEPLGRLQDLSLDTALPPLPSRTIRTSVSSRAGLGGLGAGESSPRSPWVAGHKTGAGSASFDSARARFGSPASNAAELGLGRTGSIRFPASPSTPTEGGGTTPRWRGSDSPSSRQSPAPLETSTNTCSHAGSGSPTRRLQSPYTTSSAGTGSRPGSTSPTKLNSSLPFPPSSPTKSSPSPFSISSTSPTRTPTLSSSQTLGSPTRLAQQPHQRTTSIFSKRDELGTDGLGLGRQASVRRFDSVGSSAGRAMGHRRAMTLPQNSLGAPVEGMEEGAEVVGLPNRLRLSRPADSFHPTSSTFSPSAVFSSSHNLSTSATSPSLASALPVSGSLLPSHSVKALDRARTSLIAWEYLTRCQETREWLEGVLPDTVRESEMWLGGGQQGGVKEFEQSLRNGYALAHLARKLGGERCQGGIYNDPKRHYRHTENINIFFAFQDEIGIWDVFRFETVDLYDGKNLPKVIFCLHALSKWLYKMGVISEGVRNLEGLVEFSDAELQATDRALDGVRMPDFGGIDKKLNKQEKPVESEEQRLNRLLAENTPAYIAVQAHARGALARRTFQALRRKQQALARQRQAEEEERRRQLEREEAERQRQRQLEEEEHRRRLAAEEEALEERRYQAAVQEAARTMVRFQALARGELVRREFWNKIDELHRHQRAFIGVQAQVRGVLARQRLGRQVQQLRETEEGVVGLQAVARRALAKGRLLGEIRRMRGTEGFVVDLQTAIRGKMAREAFATRKAHLRKAEVVRSVGGLQSLARAALVRRRIDVQKQALGFVEPDVVGIQAQTRGYLGRGRFLAWRDHIYRHEDSIVDLQSLVRGLLARRRYYALHDHFHRNMGAVVKLQALARSRRQGDQYRQLRMGTNVPASTIKNFVRLLDDSEFDYRDEVMVESMRKQLVGMIRETQGLEDDVKDLDTKIALLVKNKITHEVARAQRSAGGGGGLAPLQRNNLLAAAKDPFAAEALDRQTTRKLELYQQLFWHLQTTPAYFARLFANSGRAERGDKVQKALEGIAFVVFGYAQAQREEFLLLKLFQAMISEEMHHIPDVGVFVRGNLSFVRLLMQYGRGVNQRKSLQTMLNGPVKQIMATHSRPLSTDPVVVYQALLEEEEDRTGVPSSRPREVDWRFAVADKATNTVLAKHLTSLRAATEVLLRAIFASTASLPFGIRYIIREAFRSLRARFPDQPEGEILRVAGHLLYYRYIQPAIVAPETFNIVESVVPEFQRHNLAECAKMVNQISAGRAFETDQPWMAGFNHFVEVKTAEFAAWVRDVIYVPDAEVHFRADEWLDAKASRQPVVYISPNDIYSLHSAIVESLDVVAPTGQDPVREIIGELGGAPIAASGELSRARADEVPLQLTTRLSPRDDPNAEDKLLFQQAKRRIIAVLKVHHGADLVEIFAKPVTRSDEEAWHRIVQEEVWEEQRQAQASRRSIIAPVDDLRRLSYQQLKIAAIQDVMVLRSKGLVSQVDKFQALLDSIAQDIKSKHHRRVQRSHELATMQATLASLQHKKIYLSDQIRSYHEYIDQSMAGIQKKTKKGFTLPWSVQAGHQRDLERQGRRYQFGSYKYTAKSLYDKGVLLSIDQTSPVQFKDQFLSFSSDKIGVYEVSVDLKKDGITTVEYKLDDLLEMRFAAKQTLTVDNKAKLNLELLIKLLNDKFSS